MLPPLNGAVLERNQRFKLLYQDLCNSRLNSDGSSRLIKQQRAQTDIEKSLQTARVESARNQFLQEALQSIINEGSLPEELLQSCRVVCAMISGEVSQADADILEEDVHKFVFNVHKFTPLISAHLEKAAQMLSTIAYADQDPYGKDVDASQLTARVVALLNSVTTHHNSIMSTRNRIVDLLDQISTTHKEVLEVAIRILEQTVHGSVARGIKARAEHLSAVAKGLDLKIRILAKSDPLLNSPDLISALQAYGEHLTSTSKELQSQIASVKHELQEYEADGKGMAQIAARYAELGAKSDKLRLEIEKLEK